MWQNTAHAANLEELLEAGRVVDAVGELVHGGSCSGEDALEYPEARVVWEQPSGAILVFFLSLQLWGFFF